jgi:hypothetical protein
MELTQTSGSGHRHGAGTLAAMLRTVAGGGRRRGTHASSRTRLAALSPRSALRGEDAASGLDRHAAIPGEREGEESGRERRRRALFAAVTIAAVRFGRRLRERG